MPKCFRVVYNNNKMKIDKFAAENLTNYLESLCE